MYTLVRSKDREEKCSETKSEDGVRGFEMEDRRNISVTPLTALVFSHFAAFWFRNNVSVCGYKSVLFETVCYTFKNMNFFRFFYSAATSAPSRPRKYWVVGGWVGGLIHQIEYFERIEENTRKIPYS